VRYQDAEMIQIRRELDLRLTEEASKHADTMRKLEVVAREVRLEEQGLRSSAAVAR
jgi:hypothetical protein